MSSNILNHLDKNNLHHAYLIEGVKNEIIPEVLRFCENLGIKIAGNPDFCQIEIDSFKIEEAFDLRAMSSNKSFTPAKKIFILCMNSISLDAQNVLLKMFEEPIGNTHFFMIVPDTNALLKTLVSRFYLIKPEMGMSDGLKEAERFIAMPLRNRIDFIKELGVEIEEDEEGNEIAPLDSTRARSLRFLNALEFVLHKKCVSRIPLDISFFGHFFKVREFLRMPGSSAKSLMESIALITPIY